MFENLNQAPPDKIIALIAAYRDDPRPDKIDLGVGVYRDATGSTPVLATVRAAEQRLYQSQESKAYLGLVGDPGFNAAMTKLVFADSAPGERLRAVQTPGGSGALRILAELVARANPNAKLWISDPSWANHRPILSAAGFGIATYPYFNRATKGVDFDGMAATLRSLGPKDVVVLHGCCHNPTGANLSNAQWDEVAAIAIERGFLPFIDLAYQGFGDGLETDAYGVRLLAERVPEIVAAVSCSKNFGLYRDRVGCAFLIGANKDRADATLSQLLSVARSNYSMPPDHGAAVVRIILEDETLTAQWLEELNAMRERMLDLRVKLAAELQRRSNSDRFQFIAEHRGMFSLTGVEPDQVNALRQQHAVYMVGDSRINIAGLRESQIEQFAQAIMTVGG